MRGRSLLAGLIACVALSACSGRRRDRAPATAVTPATTPGASSVDAGPSQRASQGAGADLPGFMSDFDRVCETQVGFAGAAAYEAGAGLHPVVVFTDFGDPPTLIQSSPTMPEGWTVIEDANYEDNSDLADVQLVACSRRVEATPNGTTCDFEPSDGSGKVTLELTDTTYELDDLLGAERRGRGRAHGWKPPPANAPTSPRSRTATTNLNDPTEDQYINALKAIVAQ